jgi:hypothetical protein
MKWVHEVKWNKKLKRKQHTYKLGSPRGSQYVYAVKITHIIGVPVEWRYGYEGGTAGSVEEAQGIITARFVAERMAG